MATPKPKAEIIQNIDATIIPNGNIKAKDTNAILKNILDCIELNEKSQSNVDTFDLSGTNLQATQGAGLDYSFRGIKSFFANVTLHLQIKESNGLSAVYKFNHQNSAIFEIYRKIVVPKEAPLDFLVTLNRKPEQGAPPSGIATLNIRVTNQSIIITLSAYHGDKIMNGDTVFTSFTLHCPGFNQ
ncbi:hypothetical protein [Flavobacterium sp.]|uniref:hypothetical protein n=1 Tax=Flavobacterium sp. TaxID=239 RepID=UPI00286CADEB|nr:hypothetical protein [Flavobacterium sp.]